MSHDLPRIQLLLTGNELMSGDTIDSNSALIARRLGELGLPITRKVTLGDDASALERELRTMAGSADFLLVNGGLGPTVDDLTAEVLARAAGVPLREHPEALAHLETWCQKRQLPLNHANRKQALLPAGADVVPNPIGSAVGFALSLGSCRVVCTPGVPGELTAMLDRILADLQQRWGLQEKRHILRLQTFGLGESTAQQMIADACSDWPPEVELGFRAGAPQLELKLAVNRSEHLPLRQRCREQLENLFGDHIIGEGDASLASRVLELLAGRGETLTTAESCTGGRIASMLTQVPGSSAAFHAGFVTYHNDIKHRVLGVSEASLQRWGAVSEAVVREMALGALAQASADYAIAVSGVAGPDGGSPDKPVGTVWLAWGSAANLKTRCLHWPVERSLFQTMVAAAGLDAIRRMLLDLPEDSRYFRQRRATR